LSQVGKNATQYVALHYFCT